MPMINRQPVHSHQADSCSFAFLMGTDEVLVLSNSLGCDSSHGGEMIALTFPHPSAIWLDPSESENKLSVIPEPWVVVVIQWLPISQTCKV